MNESTGGNRRLQSIIVGLAGLATFLLLLRIDKWLLQQKARRELSEDSSE